MVRIVVYMTFFKNLTIVTRKANIFTNPCKADISAWWSVTNPRKADILAWKPLPVSAKNSF